MRYSINDYSVTAKQKGWGKGWPTDRSQDMKKVVNEPTGAAVNVHKRIARLVDILFAETERRGYSIKKNQTSAYNNRAIKRLHPKKGQKKVASNHSWGLAIDINSLKNKQGDMVHQDIPKWMVKLWNKYGFAWGGDYKHSTKDPMHFEFMGSPDDADDMTQKALRALNPDSPTRVNLPTTAVDTYTVRAGDTLSEIAVRLHTPGGWPALYKLNKALIGDDPGDIVVGQVLKLP